MNAKDYNVALVTSIVLNAFFDSLTQSLSFHVCSFHVCSFGRYSLLCRILLCIGMVFHRKTFFLIHGRFFGVIRSSVIGKGATTLDTDLFTRCSRILASGASFVVPVELMHAFEEDFTHWKTHDPGMANIA